MSHDYRVVLEGIGLPGNYPGIRTIHYYDSAEDFLNRLLSGQINQLVVAEDISHCEAIEKCLEIPPETIERLALDEATIGGEFDIIPFAERMTQIEFLINGIADCSIYE